MESNLVEKLSIREHLKNIKKMLGIIQNMDNTYFFLVSIVHIINVSIPYLGLVLSSYILDSLTSREYKEIMMVVIIVTAGIFVLSFIASTIWNKLEVRRERMYWIYTSMTEEKMLTLDFSRIDSPEVKEIREKINRDMNWGAGLNSVFWQFNYVLYQLFNILFALIVGMPILADIIISGRWEAGLVLCFIILFAIVAMKCRGYFNEKQVKFLHEDLKEEEKEDKFCCCWGFAYGDGFQYKNGKDIRIYHGYDLMKRWSIDVLYNSKFRKWLKEGAVSLGFIAFFYSAAQGVVEGGAYLFVVLMALLGTVSIGNVVKFAGCLKNLMTAVLGLIGNTIDLAMTAKRHISTLELLQLENEMYAGKLPMEKRSDNQYQIEFRNVSFRYPGTEQYALKNFSMKLKIGEKLAIVGMNGSGKTTMIKLLCRLYDPEEGEILLNNVDIRKFKQEEYNTLFSVVFQDFKLFPFKLAENVAVSKNYNEEQVKHCLIGSGFGERLKELEHGIDSYLYKNYDEDGLEISGGEEQKIAIARAMYKNAKFILLDEPTAALDPLSEYEIYTSFDKIIGTKTAIYISHRLSSCQFCEKIAVFHKGELVQLGSHEELVKDRQGKYYEMWQAQAQYYQTQTE